MISPVGRSDEIKSRLRQKQVRGRNRSYWDVEDFPNPNGRSLYEIIKSALENEGYGGEVSIRAYSEKKSEEYNLDDGAKTSVFWDVEDFPSPNGVSVYEIIKSAIEDEGYRGEVSIMAYGEKKREEYNLDDGVVTLEPKRGKYGRLNKMLMDIALWSVDNPAPYFTPANLMVIAKNILEETKFDRFLFLMRTYGYNLILVVANDCAPEEAQIPQAGTIWFWESLLDGAKPLDPTQLRSLLARGKRETFGCEEDDSQSEEDDDAPCPFCGS